MTSSRVATVIGQQTDLAVEEIHLDTVQGDGDGLVRALQAGIGRTDVVVVDATDRRDLTAIARAAARCASRAGTHWVAVDPGPFAPELATALGLAHRSVTGAASTEAGTPPLLVVAGSVTATTREQLAALEHVHDVAFVDLDVRTLDEDAVVATLLDRLDAAPEGAVVGVRSASDEDDVVPLERAAAEALPHRLGRIAREVVERRRVGGLYLTGGDVTMGVLDALGASGIAVDDEVLPLAVTGRVAGGPHTGLRVVTKGGLIGGRMAAVTCVDELRRRSLEDRRTTP